MHSALAAFPEKLQNFFTGEGKQRRKLFFFHSSLRGARRADLGDCLTFTEAGRFGIEKKISSHHLYPHFPPQKPIGINLSADRINEGERQGMQTFDNFLSHTTVARPQDSLSVFVFSHCKKSFPPINAFSELRILLSVSLGLYLTPINISYFPHIAVINLSRLSPAFSLPDIFLRPKWCL